MATGRAIGEKYAVVPEAIIEADISVNAKFLWVIFRLHADPEGRCYPGRKRLAELMRCSAETVKRAKKELLEAKLIVCYERYGEDGRRTTDDVYLTPPRVTTDPPRVTSDPYPRVTGDPTGSSTSKEQLRDEVASSCSPVAQVNDPPVTHDLAEHFALAAPLTDQERQRGKDAVARLREGLGR